MCLMLLSRADRRIWEESNSVSEFSDNNSVIPEPKPSHQNTPIVKDDEDENFVSKGYGGETSKMLLIEKGMQRSESSGQEYGGNVLFEKKTTEIGSCDSGFELVVFAKEFFRNDGSKKKKTKLDFESHHESTEKKFQSEIKIKSTTIDSDLGDIDVRSIRLEEASSESQKHNSSKRAKCEPYEADSEDKKRGCAARNNKRIYKCSSKMFQSRSPRHLALASNSKRCGKSIHTDGISNSKVEECKEENPIEIEQEAEAAGVSELKRRSKDYECGVCFKVFASGQALGGHKRAHYYARSFETVQEEEEEEEEEGATLVQREYSDVLDIFDLNLHIASEEGGEFNVQGLVLYTLEEEELIMSMSQCWVV